MTNWLDSDIRKNELKKLTTFSSKELQIERQEGIDFWFTPPNHEVTKPPKWKMAILTWVAVFPGVVLLSKFFHLLFPSVSSILITGFVTLTLVPMLTWVLMPNLVKLFQAWLFGK